MSKGQEGAVAGHWRDPFLVKPTVCYVVGALVINGFSYPFYNQFHSVRAYGTICSAYSFEPYLGPRKIQIQNQFCLNVFELYFGILAKFCTPDNQFTQNLKCLLIQMAISSHGNYSTLVKTSRKQKIKVKKFDTLVFNKPLYFFLVLLQGPCTLIFFFLFSLHLFNMLKTIYQDKKEAFSPFTFY